MSTGETENELEMGREKGVTINRRLLGKAVQRQILTSSRKDRKELEGWLSRRREEQFFGKPKPRNSKSSQGHTPLS